MLMQTTLRRGATEMREPSQSTSARSSRVQVAGPFRVLTMDRKDGGYSALRQRRLHELLPPPRISSAE